MGDKDNLSCITEFCEQNYEKILCRVLYWPDKKETGYIRFDKKGYLLPHSLDRQFSTVPLVHPSEWETIARYFTPRNAFSLLRILKNNLENRSWRPEKLLKHGEFFGRVNIKNIIIIEDYTWENTDSDKYKPLLTSINEPPFIK